jgi:predicted TIM-barrel fold metal-dependent hydrolase
MPDRRRAPTGYDAPVSRYLAQLDAHGMTHGVLVQPSFLGTDNSYLIESLQHNRQRLRGIAVVTPATAPQELEAMHAAGVVGIRLNLVGLATPSLADPDWQRLLATVRRLDWQVEVHREAHLLPSVVDPLLGAGVKVVVDHFGRPDATLGVTDPGFRYLLGLGPTRRVWVKLSGAYRNGAGGAGEAIAHQAIPMLRGQFGLDRLIWGSDWPHTLFEGTETYDRAVALLHGYLPDAAERAQVLWNTPQALFNF